MNIYLVRHGQTDWNVLHKIQGSTERDLNENGRQQAALLADKLSKSYHINKIFCSKQNRAVQTASIIGNKLNIKPISVDGIEEMRLGQWEGLRWDDVKTTHKGLYEQWKHDHYVNTTPDGESYESVTNRAIAAIEDVVSMSKQDDEIIIVSHGAVIMLCIRYFLGAEIERLNEFRVPNLSVVHIEYSNGKFEYKGIEKLIG